MLLGAALVAAAAAAAAAKPHIVHVLMDDMGWAEVSSALSQTLIACHRRRLMKLEGCVQVGYHRNDAGSGEVSTPTLDRIAHDGLRLERLYVHKICSPTRCALQSGRAPVHVNTQNVLPEVANPRDPVSGYQGIPVNMTGVAQLLAGAGYRTAAVGKWDCVRTSPCPCATFAPAPSPLSLPAAPAPVPTVPAGPLAPLALLEACPPACDRLPQRVLCPRLSC